MDFGFFIKGLIIGLSVSLPIGPIGVLCFRRILQGRLSGLISGLGAAFADAVYGMIAGFGLTFISDLLLSAEFWLRIIGSLFLLGFGIKLFFAPPHSTSEKEEPFRRKHRPVSDFSSVFLLTLLNPVTLLFFLAVFAGWGIGESWGDYLSTTLVVAGIFCGSSFWWVFVALFMPAFPKSFNARKWKYINRTAGALIFVFGLSALCLTLWNL